MNETVDEHLVLVLENDFALARLLTSLLQDLGLRVVVAADGSDAARLMTRHRVDLIILDAGIPPLEAIEFLRDASTYRLIPPVIVLSGQRTRRGGGVHPAFTVLPKPFGLDEISTLVTRALGGTPPGTGYVPPA